MKSVMNATENNRTTEINNAAEAEQYMKPAIEVIEMQMEETILTASGEGGEGEESEEREFSGLNWGNGGHW